MERYLYGEDGRIHRSGSSVTYVDNIDNYGVGGFTYTQVQTTDPKGHIVIESDNIKTITPNFRFPTELRKSLGRVVNIEPSSCNSLMARIEVETAYPMTLKDLVEGAPVSRSDCTSCKRIIFSGPCTILIYQIYGADQDKKVIVRCTDTEKFDWRKGALMALLKSKISKGDWKRFTKRYHKHPNKEYNAAEALLRYMSDDECIDGYLAWAKEAWKEAKSQK